MVTINYDESNPDYATSYRAVLSHGRVFASGDVVEDFARAVMYDAEKSADGTAVYSSTVDHFVNDVPGFCFARNGMIAREGTEETHTERPTIGENMHGWLEILHHFATNNSDGHMTIMAFTTGWKVLLDTPELSHAERERLNGLPAFQSLEDALQACALNHVRSRTI